jgi:hypothetical protein
MSEEVVIVEEQIIRGARLSSNRGSTYIRESDMVAAIKNQHFDGKHGESVEEIVAQLFDALEEKNLEENADLEEYETSLLPVQALGASALEFAKLAHFLADRGFADGDLGIDSAIEYIESLDDGLYKLQGLALCSDCVEALEQDLDDEKATVASLETELDTLVEFVKAVAPGEISKGDYVVPATVRLINKLKSQLDHLVIVNRTLNDELTLGKESVNYYAGQAAILRAELDKARPEFVYPGSPVNSTPLPASFTLKNDVPTPYQAPKSGPAQCQVTKTGHSPYNNVDWKYYEDCSCVHCGDRRRYLGKAA